MQLTDLKSSKNNLLQPPITWAQIPKYAKNKIEQLKPDLWQKAIDQYATDLYWSLVIERQREFRSNLGGENNQILLKEYDAALHPDLYENRRTPKKFALHQTLTVNGKEGVIVGFYWRLWSNPGWSYLIEYSIDDCFYYQELILESLTK